MAIDKIVIQVEGDAKGVDSTIAKLEKLGLIDKANAAQFAKSNREFTEASKKKIELIVTLEKQVKSLQDAIEKSQNPKLTQSPNVALAEQNKRLIAARASAKGLTTQLKETGQTASILKGQFSQLGAQIAGAFAVTQLLQFGKEAVQLAAKAEGITLAFGRLNRPDLLANLRTATRGTITDLSLMTAAVKAENFKLPLENLATFFKFAQQRARETGESVDYLVESIVTGIGRKSPLILDNLGISAVELRKALKGVGVETADVGDIASAVGLIIDRELKKQGDLALTTADKIDQMAVRWNNVKIGTGNALIAAVNYFGSIKEGVEDVDALLKARLFRGFSAQLNQGLGEFEDAMANWASAQNKANEPQKEQIRNVAFLKNLLEELTKELVLEGKTVEENKATIQEINKVQEELNRLLGKEAKAHEEATKAAKEHSDAMKADYERRMDLLNLYISETEGAKNDELKKEKERLELEYELYRNNLDKKSAEYDAWSAKMLEKIKVEAEKELAEEEKTAQKKKEIEQALTSAVSELISSAIDYQLALQRQATDYKLSLLQEEFNSERITLEQFNQQRRIILTDQAQKEKEAAIIKATIDTATAVISAFADGGPVLAAIAAALGLAQIAIISATPIPQFEKGGKVKGKSHREGGVHAELEGDEFIISKKAARKIGFDNLEMLNKGIVPVKLLRQSLSDQRSKSFENSMKHIFGSTDFDTYPIEKELKKNRKNDTELTHLLIKQLSKGQQKRGNYK